LQKRVKKLLRHRTKVIFSSVIGNALEFYDFTLYGVFAPVLALIFFPDTGEDTALILTLATFGVGYVTRPLGAIFLGHIGDKHGRKRALSYAIVLMAIPTTLIGLLPSYQSIGIMAPILLVLCRLLQGLCAGGEYNGAAIFLIEHGKPEHKSFYSSLVAASGAVGAVAASLLGAFLLANFQADWIWRIPFLLGAVLGVVGLYIRSQVNESPEFIKEAKKKLPERLPFVIIFKNYFKPFLVTVFAAGLSGTFSSSLVVYINSHLVEIVGIPSSQSLIFNSIGLGLYILFSPITGYLGDQFGIKRIMQVGAGGIIVLAFPLFFLLQTASFSYIFIAQIMLAFLAASFISPLNAFLNHLFPVSVRFSGVAVGSNLGKALLGGWMPAISLFLIQYTNNPFMPAIYLMVMGGIALFVIRFASDKEEN
jgi:MHS family proline/betaine transporter-like MFS transporter